MVRWKSVWHRAADALASRAMKKSVDTSLSVEKRLETLEREFAMLRDQVLGLKPLTKDWRATIGILPDDDLTRSALRRGAAWRKRRKHS